jgi:recombination protein RecA
VRLGDALEPANLEVIPSGFPVLDAALGIGGLPCGRISEISGPDSSGKQALAAHLIAQCQRAEGVAAYIDVGHRLDPEQTKVVGVDLDSLLVARPEDAQLAMEMAVRLVRGGGIRLLIFDATESHQTSDISRPLITHHSSPITSLNTQHSALSTSFLRRLVSAVDRNGVAFVFITNSQASAPGSRSFPGHPARDRVHPRAVIPAQAGIHNTSGPWMPDQVRHDRGGRTPRGGQALRFFASVRLAMERTEWIRRGREVVGCRSTVRVAKNKLSAPHREATVELLLYRFPPSMPAVQLCRPAQTTAPAIRAARGR